MKKFKQHLLILLVCYLNLGLCYRYLEFLTKEHKSEKFFKNGKNLARVYFGRNSEIFQKFWYY